MRKYNNSVRPSHEYAHMTNSIIFFSMGAIAGGGQWLLIRNKVKKAGRWVFASAIGAAAGVAASDATSGAVQYNILASLGYSGSGMVIRGLYWTFYGLVFGLITGPVISGLPRKP